ncbi:MAG: hypothetical protein ACRDJJ_10225 [Actinomycetota bacterium]
MNDERAARYSDLFAESHDHASDCAYCPICATIAVVRNTKPEVLDHLASAARELIAAVGLLLEEAETVIGTAETMPAEEQRTARVRKIDIG